MQSKSDNYGEAIRVYTDGAGLMPWNKRAEGVETAVLTPDGRLEPVTHDVRPPTRLGYWAMIAWQLDQDDVTGEFTALIDVIDAADRSIVHHVTRPLNVKTKKYAEQHAAQEAETAAVRLGYAKIVDEEAITWPAND